MAEPKEQAVRFDIRKIYLKDVSFESPQAPNVFIQQEQTPAIDMQITIDHTTLSDDAGFHEVVLNATVTAKNGEQVIFLTEVQQAGVFQIQGVNEETLPLALEIACPNVLLPFAREAIADLVAKGGFPQLLVNPVNFEALYHRKHGERAATGDTGGNGDATDKGDGQTPPGKEASAG